MFETAVVFNIEDRGTRRSVLRRKRGNLQPGFILIVARSWSVLWEAGIEWVALH